MGVGIIFLWPGISETLSELQELEEFKMGAHHGVIIYQLPSPFFDPLGGALKRPTPKANS
jgi:hypothetical protein